VFDPDRRITAKEALHHPCLTEMAQPDDGTAAAQIRRKIHNRASGSATS
jgi:hypothetical protein